MKKYITVILITFLFSSCGYIKSDHVWIAGTNFEKLQKAKPKDCGVIILGAVGSVITHEFAHIILLEAFNADYKIETKLSGFYIEYEDLHSDSKTRWVSRAGLLSQNLVGLFLPKDSYFTMGYNSASAIETFTYPLRRSDKGDLYEIDEHGGDSKIEWGIYSLISAHNLLRIEW